MHSFVSYIKQYKNTLFLLGLLTIVSVIYSTHLELVQIPKGYDLFFHLGNVFAFQVALGFSHTSLASLAISPVIFHDFGYGTHLFYPPLAHIIPAVTAFLLSKVGINSTLVAIRLFSFLTIFFSGASMYFAAKKMTNNTVYACFASLLYLSGPYLQWDYYWRGGMSSSLCFVFLPILLLSVYYFSKEKFTPYFFAFVTSVTFLVWSHLITAFFSFIIFAIAIGINFLFIKNKKAAFITTVIGGLMVGVITSPFWSLLLQQQMLHTHVIYSPDYPFSIASVASNTVPFKVLFDIQIFVWQWKIRDIFALFSIITVGFSIAFLLLIKPINRTFKNSRFLITMMGLLVLLLAMVTTKSLWTYLPSYFAFIQYPPRLLLLATPILTFLIAMPFILIKKTSPKTLVSLGLLAIFIVAYTFKFNNYALYRLGQIDYTTFSILQATGVDYEYLPVNSKKEFEPLEKRPSGIVAITNGKTKDATPSGTIVTNETPYFLAKIEKNENKHTLFELPRLFYAGYELTWKAEGSQTTESLSYSQSKGGLIVADISGNGTLEVQFTGGKWYWLFCLSAVGVSAYLLWLLYTYLFAKKSFWLKKL